MEIKIASLISFLIIDMIKPMISINNDSLPANGICDM